ncbi:zinc finger CW-type PWWP domain protein 2 [Crotalus tigris]|uniref:zinc finger CW-type PWWP domain protein 2 n=1 Tax=Crotalus tigris TaxID=88082 RepID=UPI00192F42E2|nr:zinc finger CW-type PWWP domain protein 2 [Crotalus tigris]
MLLTVFDGFHCLPLVSSENQTLDKIDLLNDNSICHRKEEGTNILQTIRVKTCYMDSVKENNFYIGKGWIQCENRDCLKWRLLQQDDIENIDSNTPWYCYMNIDPKFNKCSVAEEYFPKESQFQKHGLKYIYSKFPLGSLVLAKMKTWPRWPGILSPDPVDGQYVKYDFNGDVESHHVEFLGNPHSRSWTAIKYIDLYPNSFKADVCKKKKAWYDSALEEANKLLAYSTQQRLDICYLSKKGTVIWPLVVIIHKHFNFYVCKYFSQLKVVQKNVGRKLVTEMEGILIVDSQQILITFSIFRQRMLTYPCKIARSEDILSRQSLVVTETEIILKDLDQILSQVLVTSKPFLESSGNREDNNEREEVLNCSLEASEESRPMEISTEEDCIIIDGKAFMAGECIESITEQFKEIDYLMADFQGSL